MKSGSRRLMALAITGLMTLPLAAHAQTGLAKTPYAKFRGDNQNTGRGGGAGAEGEKKWVLTTGGGIPCSASIGPDGKIYFVSNDHKLYILDRKGDGQSFESETLGGSSAGPGQAPAIGADGTIYVGDPGGYTDDNRGQLIAFKPDGTRKWEFKAKAPVYSSPAIGDNGLVYVGSQDGYVYAIDCATGKKKWAYEIGSQVRASPAIGKDGTIYIGGHDGNIHAIDGTTGKKKWASPTSAPYVMASAVIGDDGTVYAGCSGGAATGPPHLYAFDPKTGAKKWETENFNGTASPALGKDGTLYVQSNNGVFMALDPKTGNKKWEKILEIPGSSSPSIGSDGTIYVGAGRYVFALDPEDGSKKWQFETKSSIYASPTIDEDGTIYIGSDDGNFYAIK